jgi:hypothetical protein
MKNDVTLEMLQQLNNELHFELYLPATTVNTGLIKHPPLNENVTEYTTPETPSEIEKLKNALSILSADVDRGQGKFYTQSGQPTSDYWLAVVWAIASLGWASGKEIAREWSMLAPSRYTEDGFDKAWSDYKANHPNPIGIGSLYKRAMVIDR